MISENITAPGGPHRRSATLVALFLFVGGSFAIYANALSFDFLNFDDSFYVRDNAHLNGGFSWDAVRWALEANLLRGDRSAEYWMPITMFSRLVDAEFFGASGGLHHLQNILFHGLNAWLLFVILADLTGAFRRSTLVAALFLVHPINAEVVCWIALRKDVLAGTASLLTIFMYVRYVRRPTLPRYLAALAAFGGAFLCKPSVVSLPLALLLLDWWPLNRLRVGSADGAGGRSMVPALSVLAEKLPFLILALVASLVTFVGQRDLGLAGIRGDHALWVDLGRTAVGYLDYVRRAVLLEPFCALYPMRPWDAISRSDLWQAAILLFSVTLGSAWLAVRKYRPALMGWTWFIGLLLPVSGLVQFGRQATADRYMYLPLIGLLIFFVWLCGDLVAFRGTAKSAPVARWRSVTVSAFALMLVGFLSLLSRAQSLTWRNDSALWTQAMAVEPDSEVAFNNFGSALTLAGEHKASETYRRAALKIAPDSVEQIGNLGKSMARYGNAAGAAVLLERAIHLDPLDMENHRWLAIALRRAGRLADADAATGRYEQIRGRAFLGTGLTYLKQGETDLAKAQFSSASTALLRARRFAKSDRELVPAARWLPSARDWLVRIPTTVLSGDDRTMLQGYISYLAGDVGSAARWFGIVATRQQRLAEPRWWLAICLDELGQTEAANREATAARECPVPFEEGANDWSFLHGGNSEGAPAVVPPRTNDATTDLPPR